MLSSNITKYLFLSLIVAFSVSSFWVRNANIKRHLPYIGHIDEERLTVPALKIIQSGDFNPRSFMYPSLPIYLNSIGFSLGFLNGASQGNIRKVEDIGRVTYPFYQSPLVVLASKQIFALISVLAAFFTGLIAYKAFRRAYLIFLPPFLVSFSPLYMEESWVYLNVDIIGAFFVISSLTYIFFGWNKKGIMRDAVLPGILCGLCIASKYNLFLICLPFFLFIILRLDKNRILSLIVLFVVSVITFVLVVPYSLADYASFINDVGRQISIYSTGHKGHDGPTGWPQFAFYMGSIAKQYGWGAFVFSLIGIFYIFRLNWRYGAVLCSFPILFILFMSTIKVHFIRNMTAVYLLWPIFISIGFMGLYDFLSRTAKSISIFKGQTYEKISVWIVAVGLLIAVLPYESFISNLRVYTDTRNEAAQWINRNVKRGSTIVVPDDLFMDMRSMEDDYNIINITRKELIFDTLNGKLPKRGEYILVPYYGYDKRWPDRAELAQRLNSLLVRLKHGSQVLKRFEGEPVNIKYWPPVMHYSPMFSIVGF